MRRTHWVAGALGFMSVASGAYTTGCFFNSVEDCTKTLMCGASSEAGTTTTSTSTGTGTAPGCIPSENSGPVGDGCGVFVALDGDDGDDGSKSSPVKTLKKAIELAKANGNTVYACAGSFNEAVELPGSVSLFGGLDCKGDWGHGGETKRTVIAPVVAANPPPMADVIPLKVLGNGDIRIENVDVRAPDAVLPGGSSIAVIVENTTAAIANCTFTAGAAKDGDKGVTPMESVGPSDSDDPLIRGENGGKACTGDATGNPGGATKANISCNTSIGGAGGVGLEDKGENGLDGAPSGAIGKGGLGQPASGAWSCGTTGNGQAGDDGVSGPSGAGATELGTIDAAGFAGVDGAPGSPGTPGQAGGGGGGAKGKASCNGASGGGGGAGGCGGAGGLGGQAGGSSIALISVNAKLTFEGVTLKAGAGGKGGDGGDGQGGAPGGNGGNGGLGDASAPTTSKACNGGPGGQGGTGGKGGGGRGGHSIGIAFKGAPTSKEGVTITIGAPGEGGAGADMTGNGKVGEKAQTFELKN